MKYIKLCKNIKFNWIDPNQEDLWKFSDCLRRQLLKLNHYGIGLNINSIDVKKINLGCAQLTLNINLRHMDMANHMKVMTYISCFISRSIKEYEGFADEERMAELKYSQIFKDYKFAKSKVVKLNKATAGKCAGCGKINEYQEASYICWECK